MNLNNYKNIKLNILRDYLKAKFSNQPYNIKERFNLFTKEFESENQNVQEQESMTLNVLDLL